MDEIPKLSTTSKNVRRLQREIDIVDYLLKLGIAKQSIAAAYGVSRTTLNKYLPNPKPKHLSPRVDHTAFGHSYDYSISEDAQQALRAVSIYINESTWEISMYSADPTPLRYIAETIERRSNTVRIHTRPKENLHYITFTSKIIGMILRDWQNTR